MCTQARDTDWGSMPHADHVEVAQTRDTGSVRAAHGPS